ncbi:MAG TPA: lmo0937 family membrane protein [Patescibacteria group bacterium]|nr:lmo0937 family membrane protein [Patescibacteria group bacterium]
MFWTIIIVLFVLWLLGFSFRIGGKLIHALIVIALILFILQLLHIV